MRRRVLDHTEAIPLGPELGCHLFADRGKLPESAEEAERPSPLGSAPLGSASLAGPDVPEWLAELLRFIDANVESPVTVSDLPPACGRSAEHIARCFRALLDTTPSQAINTARVNRAALLLARTNRGILDICFGLGYNSASYFYRVFRNRHGLPPYRYRLEHSMLRPRLPIDPETYRSRTKGPPGVSRTKPRRRR